MRALRKGCNRRWETGGVNPAVTRQQMGHSDARMTTLYTGEIPLKDVQVAFTGLRTWMKSLKWKMMENGKLLKSV